MPRKADLHLQERILKSAQALWRERGEKGLTLRSVARAAGTTTTTVYKRFRNKAALCLAIAEKVQEKMVATITSSSSLEEATRRYLHFAESHPREYRLLYGTSWPEIFGPGRPRPAQDWIMAQLAARFGGQPKDYAQIHFALFLATHGAASLLAAAPRSRQNVQAREWCIAICDTLIKNIHIFRREPGSSTSSQARLKDAAVDTK
jgi:AcrR family transcriptional regulator